MFIRIKDTVFNSEKIDHIQIVNENTIRVITIEEDLTFKNLSEDVIRNIMMKLNVSLYDDY